ncbi:MAG TPA: hypothetical protein VN767_18285 [Streptosporangiaceae bacterium]|jgi:hypothetical protein|nr:hypothetical protein [Streptosporangiaceae bacterium]
MIRKNGVRKYGVLAVMAGLLTVGLSAAVVPAAVAGPKVPAAYSFRKIDNGGDRSFNQLLAINSSGRIAGYFGSGVHGHPNKGYLVSRPYGSHSYRAVNFPGSAQTQVTGINDKGVAVGFFSRTNKSNPGLNANVGFYLKGGKFHQVKFPTGNVSNPSVNQLLGINNAGIAVGFFFDALGQAHAYRYNISNHKFAMLNIKGSGNATATSINAGGSIAGFFINSSGRVVGFLRHPNGQIATLSRPGADLTQAFGVNKAGLVVGAYTIGNSTFGFTWQAGRGFRTVNDPNGVGSTFVNGVNNAGDLVGFYTDRNGNTNGMLAIP